MMVQNGPHIDRLLLSQLRSPMLNEAMRSSAMRDEVLDIAEEIKTRWQAKIPKDSGNLRSTATTRAFRSPEYEDRRWVAEFSAGGPRAPYAPMVEAETHALAEVLRDMGYGGSVGGTDRSGPTGRVAPEQREPTVRLYHRTQYPETADAIVREGFKPTFREGIEESYVRENSQYGYFTEDPDAQGAYGQHIVAVDVPRSMVQEDPWSGHYRVPVADLEGRSFEHYELADDEE
jgi:hypothetical protein